MQINIGTQKCKAWPFVLGPMGVSASCVYDEGHEGDHKQPSGEFTITWFSLGSSSVTN